MLYSIIFKTHVVVSVIALVSGIAIVILSGIGISRNKDYTSLHFRTSLVFTISLYLQLILGSMIYFYMRAPLEGINAQVAQSPEDAAFRFWAIEHIALMIFALFLSQLGRIYIKRSGTSVKRHRAALFYYGTSLLVILFSLSVALFIK